MKTKREKTINLMFFFKLMLIWVGLAMAKGSVAPSRKGGKPLSV
jgi:hypothetical protein